MRRERMAARLASFFLLVSASGCALPQRDNPNDPTRRPRASLLVHVEGDPTLNVGSRTTSFVLDASGSVDPLDRGDLTFAWDLDDDPEDFEVEGSEPCPSGAPAGCLLSRLSIPPGFLPDGVGSFQRQVRVRVTDAGGGFFDVAGSTAVLVNVAPVLDPGEDLFVPELTGASVTLDACGGNAEGCASNDPDGDPLSFEWRQRRGDSVLAGAVLGSALTFQAPTAEQTMLFELSADDGLARVTRLLRVHVSTQVWVTTSDPTRVYRIYPEFRALRMYEEDATVRPLPEGGLATGNDGGVWVGVGKIQVSSGFLDGFEIERLAPGLDGLEILDQWTGPGAFVPTSIAPVGDGGCVALRTHTDDEGTSFSPPSRFARLIPGGTIVDAPDSAALAAEPKFVFPIPDGSGDCWAVTGELPGGPAAGSVYRLHADGSLDSMAEDVLDDVTAAASASDGTLWLAGRVSECQAGSRILRIDPFGGGPVTVSDCSAADVDALAIDADGAAFAHDRNTLGILHLDSAGIATPTGAIEIALPEGPGAGFFPRAEPPMLFDPVERHLWMVEGFSGSLVRMVGRGARLEDPEVVSAPSFPAVGNLPEFRAVALAGDVGRLVATALEEGTGGALMHVPVHMRRVDALLLSSPLIGITPEPVRGDIWVNDAGSTSLYPLRRLTQRGLTQARVEVEGSVWDVAAQRDGGAWAAIESAGTGELLRVDAAGHSLGGWNYSEPLVAIDGRDDLSGARLCAASVDPGTLEGDLIRFDPFSSSAQTLDAPGGLREPRGARVHEASAACWFSFTGTGASDHGIVRWDGTGAPVVSAIEATGWLSIDPIDGSAWVTAFDDSTFLVSAYTVSADGTSTPRFGLPSADILAMEIQRRCAPSGCMAGDPLHVWAIDGQNLLRLDGQGVEFDRFLIPEIGSFSGLEVMP